MQQYKKTLQNSDEQTADLQRKAVGRDLHLAAIIASENIKASDIAAEQENFKTRTYEEERLKLINEKIAKYKAASNISINDIILAGLVYLAFSFAFTQSLLAWAVWAATALGVSIFSATILLTAAVMLIRVGRAESYLVKKSTEVSKQFYELSSQQKIEYALYGMLFIGFLIIPFMPFGGVFFQAVLAQASILFEIGTVPTAIILMIVWALIPITVTNGITAHNKESEKDNIINKELMQKNPLHRIRYAYFKLFNTLYLYGMQNPISMLAFSIVFFGTIIDMCYPFLPTALHHTLLTLAYGVTNAALGPFVTGFMLGWFLGLFTLVICDIIARSESNTSGTLLNCAWLRDHLLDAILFTIVLIIGAQLMSGSAIAYICGNWEILGLLTINLKPLLGIYDFVIDPVKSVIGTCTILVPFMPFVIVMYPELCIEYLLDFILTSIATTIRYMLSVCLVLITAVMDLVILANKALCKYISIIPDATTDIATHRDDLFYGFEKLRASIETSYANNSILPSIAAFIGKILNIAYIITSTVITLCATSALIPNIILPKILLSWGMWPVTILASYFGMPAAAIITAMAGAYMLSLSLCNFFVDLDDRTTNAYLKDNLFIALLFFVICPLCVVYAQAAIAPIYSAFAIYSFDLAAVIFSLIPCYMLNSRTYIAKKDPMLLDIYNDISKKSSDLATFIDDNTKPAQNLAHRAYTASKPENIIQEISKFASYIGITSKTKVA